MEIWDANGNLEDAIHACHLPAALFDVLQDWMQAHKEDLENRINKTGQYSPDY